MFAHDDDEIIDTQVSTKQGSTASAASPNNKNSGSKLLYVFSGPSGSGKSTLIKRLMSEYPDRFAFSVSHTTRQPRPGERAGVDYHYVDKLTIDKMIANKEFVEHAQFSGNTYGTSLRAIDDITTTGRLCLLDVDMQGVKNVKQARLPAKFVFVKPPSQAELERRLRGRGTEGEEAVQKRLAAARAELIYADEAGAYDYVIVNDNLDHAYEQLKTILVDKNQDARDDAAESNREEAAGTATKASAELVSHA